MYIIARSGQQEHKLYLLLGDLFVAVNIQSFKQVWWILLEPHKQVTRRDAFLKAYQFDVKNQHSAAWNTSCYKP